MSGAGAPRHAGYFMKSALRRVLALWHSRPQRSGPVCHTHASIALVAPAHVVILVLWHPGALLFRSCGTQVLLLTLRATKKILGRRPVAGAPVQDLRKRAGGT